MIIVFIGAPGAGKGTQAEMLVSFNEKYRQISTGQCLRKHVKLKTEIGKKAEAIMSSGNLVPDDVLAEILSEEMGTDKSEKIILDGFPRNVAQAEYIDKNMSDVQNVSAVVYFDVPEADLIGRLTGRRVCSGCNKNYHIEFKPPKSEVCDHCEGEIIQRIDDQPEKVKHRLAVYRDQTQPVIEYYQKNSSNFIRIDGSKKPEDVFKEVVGSLEG